jgi:hypothetical protein
MGTIADFKIPEYYFHGTHTLEFKLPARESE